MSQMAEYPRAANYPRRQNIPGGKPPRGQTIPGGKLSQEVSYPRGLIIITIRSIRRSSSGRSRTGRKNVAQAAKSCVNALQ